jgi:hypothetical protein
VTQRQGCLFGLNSVLILLVKIVHIGIFVSSDIKQKKEWVLHDVLCKTTNGISLSSQMGFTCSLSSQCSFRISRAREGLFYVKQRQTTLEEFEGLRECVEDLEKMRNAYKRKFDNRAKTS